METLQASLKHEARDAKREFAGREERSLRVYQQGARRGSRAHVEPLVTRPGSQRQKTVWTASIILRDETALRNMCGIDGHVADETARPTVCAYMRDAPNTRPECPGVWACCALGRKGRACLLVSGDRQVARERAQQVLWAFEWPVRTFANGFWVLWPLGADAHA